MYGLLNYQIPHVEKLIKSLNTYNVAVDASDTGTGKTYCALAVAKKLNLKPFIVCPKCVISSWKRVARTLNIEPIMVINYDQIISPSISNSLDQENKIQILNQSLNKNNNINELNVLEIAVPKTKSTKSKKIKFNSGQLKPFLQYCKKKFGGQIEITSERSLDHSSVITSNTSGRSKDHSSVLAEQINDSDSENKSKQKQKEILIGFEWTLPTDSIIIFDEVHRCKNKKTLHYQLLKSVREYVSSQIKCLVLSATIADKINYFGPIGYTLGWYTNIDKFKVWLKRKSVETGFPLNRTIHHMLFPFYGSRLRISELGNLFPRNQIIPECYDMDNAREIENQYLIIKKAIEDLRTKKENAGCILEIILRARQMIEMLKYPTFCELIDDHLENGLSVVVFVNFNDTMNKLAQTFETCSVIHGKQTEDQRIKVIEDFQSNKTNIIIANIKAGGVGISLHDLHGGHPRVSIISPTWSAQDTMQTLGRIHRAEGKTPAIQKFVFCAGTIEEYICDKLREKLDNMSMINDGNLHPFPKLEIEPNTESESDEESDSIIVETKKKTKKVKAKKGKSCSDFLNI